MLEGAKYYRKRKGGSGGQRRAQKGRPVEKVVFEQARRNERVSPEVVQGKAKAMSVSSQDFGLGGLGCWC